MPPSPALPDRPSRTRGILAALWPTRLLSRLLGAVLALPLPPWQRLLVRLYVRLVRPELEDADPPDARLYPDLDALFTRPARAGSRPWPAAADLLGAPVDGVFLGRSVLAEGRGTALEVKGVRTDAGALLGPLWAELPPAPGAGVFHFYLSPRHLHRVFLPTAGRLLYLRHLPGRLLPVAPPWLGAVRDLNARNERTLLAFATPWGPLVLVLVAAFGVSDIETAFEPPRKRPRLAPLPGGVTLGAGSEVGCFHLGSTVFVIAPPALSRPLLGPPPLAVRAGTAFAGPASA